jgi:hypothetical protein
MDSSEATWRSLCLKLATERDPVRLAVFYKMLDEMLESYVEDLAAKKILGIEDIGLSRYIN